MKEVGDDQPLYTNSVSDSLPNIHFYSHCTILVIYTGHDHDPPPPLPHQPHKEGN